MEYLPIAAIIYGLFLLFLSMQFSKYSYSEFTTLVYGVVFLGLGIVISLLDVLASATTMPQSDSNFYWFVGALFFATALHILFKVSRIVKISRAADIDRVQEDRNQQAT